MNTDNHEQKTNEVITKAMTWVVAIVLALLAFYLMDHFIMGMQGLPLNWDLTPAQ